MLSRRRHGGVNRRSGPGTANRRAIHEWTALYPNGSDNVVGWSAILGVQQSLNLRGRPLGILPQSLHRYAAGRVLGLLSAAALILVARRMAGALAQSAGTGHAAGRRRRGRGRRGRDSLEPGFRRRPGTRLPGIDRAVMLLTSLAVAALGAGLCLPGTSAVGMFLLWTLLGAEESWAWGWRLRRGFAESPSGSERPAVRTAPAHVGPPHSQPGQHRLPARHRPWTPKTSFFRRGSRSNSRAARLPTARRNFRVGCGSRLWPASGRAAFTWLLSALYRHPRIGGGAARGAGGPREDGPTDALRRPARSEAGRAADEPTSVLLQFSARAGSGKK